MDLTAIKIENVYQSYKIEDDFLAAFDAIMSEKLLNGSSGLPELLSYVWMPGEQCDSRLIATDLLVALEDHPDRDTLSRQLLLEYLHLYAKAYLEELAVIETAVQRARSLGVELQEGL